MQTLSFKEIEMLDLKSKKEYLQILKEYSNSLKYNTHSKEVLKKIIATLAPHLRKYDLDIIGEENIPKHSAALFICNHSNSHEFFTIHEVFNNLKRPVTPFGAIDCLDWFTTGLFKAGDVTLIDRDDKNSSLEGMMLFAKKIMSGLDGVIFSESTWNLHPIKPMQPIKAGGTQVALISDVAIIPTIFEYVEVNDIVKKEKELYTKCIVSFEKPISVKVDDNIFLKTKEIQAVLESMRLDLWKKLGIKKSSLDDINKDIYLNHTYLKKFDALGFEYDSDHEFKYLLKDKNGYYENEYHLDEVGNFVPGITYKKDKKR